MLELVLLLPVTPGFTVLWLFKTFAILIGGFVLLDSYFDASYAFLSICALGLLLLYIVVVSGHRVICRHPVSRWVAVVVGSLGLATYVYGL